MCREYRIPIKAALNGTAGAHTLKIVISPAAVNAMEKASNYKYNVPGLTQPGTMVILSMLILDHLSVRLPPYAAAYLGCSVSHQIGAGICRRGCTSKLENSVPSFDTSMANAAGGLSYYNFIRKPASDFGWDWGPAFAPAGIYGIVEIQAYSHAIMTGAYLH